MKELADTHIEDVELNHHLQRQILNSFQHQDACTYSDLLIDGMSGNSFLYHLKALIRHKLIHKTATQTYELTPLGRLTLDNLSFETHRFRLRPTTGVLLMASAPSGKIMFYRSHRQPFIGKTGLVFGKSRVGQSFDDIIERITSRRGISDYTIVDTAPISIIYRHDGAVVSHRIGLFVHLHTKAETPARTTEAGQTFWAKPEEIIDYLPELSIAKGKLADYIQIDSIV